MKTIRENYMDLLNTGKSERLVKQYEPFAFIMNDPLLGQEYGFRVKGKTLKDPWGTVISWPETEHAGMPYITEENKVCPDVTRWREYVKASNLEFPEEAWAPAIEAANQVDREEYLVTGVMVTGIFERMHFLMGFEDTLMNLLLEPEAMEELADYILEWKLEYAKQLIDHLHPDAMLSHDDWGAKDRLFMSRDVWVEIFKPRYEKLYGYIRSRGVQVIHHADSYMANIVEDMVDCHINVWQGVLPTNDVPALLRQLDGRMLLMGDLDAGAFDFEGWTQDDIEKEVRRAVGECQGLKGFIPCITYGLSESIFPGVYEGISQAIDKVNGERISEQ